MFLSLQYSDKQNFYYEYIVQQLVNYGVTCHRMYYESYHINDMCDLMTRVYTSHIVLSYRKKNYTDPEKLD